MKTYVQQCKDNLIKLNEETFNSFVDFWNKSDQTRNLTLNEAIGVSLEEYRKHGVDFKSMSNILKSKINK